MAPEVISRLVMIEVLSSCPTSRQDDQALTCVLNFTTYLWHKAQAGLRGCPTTPLTPAFVILSEAKNLMDSGTYNAEILRLVPQNDVVGQPLGGISPLHYSITPNHNQKLWERLSPPRLALLAWRARWRAGSRDSSFRNSPQANIRNPD